MRQKREKTTAEIAVDLAKKTAYSIPSTAVRPTTVEPFSQLNKRKSIYPSCGNADSKTWFKLSSRKVDGILILIR